MAAMEETKLRMEAATEMDLDYLLELRKLTMTEYLESSGLPVTDEEHLIRLKYQFSHSQLLFNNDVKVGMVKFVQDKETLSLIQLQIHPQYQGQGLGAKVISLLSELASTDVAKIRLSVLKTNPAKRLYQRLGFIQYGECEHELYMEMVL